MSTDDGQPGDLAAAGVEPRSLVVLLLAIALLLGLDVVFDWLQGGDLRHAALEVVGATVALAGAGVTVRALLTERQRAQEALAVAQAAVAAGHERRARVEAEAARWRTEAEALLRGLGAAIDAQLERWALTEAERQVALLLLKGLSTKEIAAVRDTTDRTVRQQAQAIYAKAGLAGRAELSAFFLEDLLLPRDR